MQAVLNRWLRRVPIGAVWLVGLIPLGLLVWDIFTDGLGVEPVRDIEHRLGRTALYFLVGSLAVTPLLRLTRISLIRFRRALGLLCFTYALLHLSAWASMDMGFLWPQMGRDVVKRPYLVLGMAGFLILLALAATSNSASIRSLGAHGWKRLHRLAYLAAPLIALHWIWSLKAFPVIPGLWLTLILMILGLRMLDQRRPRSASRKSLNKNHANTIT